LEHTECPEFRLSDALLTEANGQDLRCFAPRPMGAKMRGVGSIRKVETNHLTASIYDTHNTVLHIGHPD